MGWCVLATRGRLASPHSPDVRHQVKMNTGITIAITALLYLAVTPIYGDMTNNTSAATELHGLVAQVADALKKYGDGNNGTLPQSINFLTSRVAVTQTVFPLRRTNLDIAREMPISIIYTPRDRLRYDAGFTQLVLIAYTSRETEEGLRYAITEDYRVIVSSEQGFQKSIAGIVDYDTNDVINVNVR